MNDKLTVGPKIGKVTDCYEMIIDVVFFSLPI